MGSADYIGKLEQRKIGWRRFDLKDIESSGGDLAARQCVIQRLFINESAARTIDHAGAFFHEGDALPVENRPSLGSHR